MRKKAREMGKPPNVTQSDLLCAGGETGESVRVDEMIIQWQEWKERLFVCVCVWRRAFGQSADKSLNFNILRAGAK